LLAITLAVASACASGDTVITFDDINASADTQVIPNGYAGMAWDNFGVAKAAAFPNTGFAAGTVSGTSAAFNMNGGNASINLIDYANGWTFNLLSMYVTKASGSGGFTRFYGLIDRQFAYTKEVFSSSTQPTLAVFNWTNLMAIVIEDYDASGATVLDSMTISLSSVPEPTSYTMLLAGLGLIGAAVRRRRT
jgi:hypothetical protein